MLGRRVTGLAMHEMCLLPVRGECRITRGRGRFVREREAPPDPGVREAVRESWTGYPDTKVGQSPVGQDSQLSQ